MVRTDRWKLIAYHDRVELFDLAVDPNEKNDIADSNPNQVGKLYRLLRGPVLDDESFPLNPRAGQAAGSRIPIMLLDFLDPCPFARICAQGLG